jgi:hypothetical protein
MRPVTYSYPTAVFNAVAATQSWTTSTGSYVVLNGSLTQQVQGTVDGSQRYAVLPGIQRTIGIFSTGNLSAVVFYASGTDTRGQVVTASFAGPSGGSSTASDAFATFTSEFNQINYLYATAAATSAFTVGVGATGSTRWTMTDYYIAPFAMTVAVNTASSLPVTVQDTPQNANEVAPTQIFNHSTLATVTTSAESNYAFPARFVRAIFTPTGTATGAGTVTFIQAGA